MRSKVLSQDENLRTFVVVFDAGDEASAGLLEFAKANDLSTSQLTGVGGFEKATLGFFDIDRKDYKEIPISDQTEVLSVTADVTLEESGDPKVHAHVVLGKADGSTVGGHLLDGIVKPTLEIIVIESPAYLKRREDPESGLPLIDF
jgi:predicted DNA-binding protein with PD1-like motif